MTLTRSAFSFLLVLFAIGFALMALPLVANAQNDKGHKEKRHQEEEDDHDGDENISAEEKASVKVTMAEAKAIALKRISGKVIDAELEREKGRLQYAFDIKDSAGKVWDVEIDAMTGEVLQAKEDSEDDEDTDNDGGVAKKAKRPIYRAASKMKRVTLKTVGKLY